MDMFSPKRPYINSQPAYGDPALAVLPHLHVKPLPNGNVKVSAILCKVRGTFHWKEAEVRPGDLPGVMMDYATDPEALLLRLFNYTPPRGVATTAGPLPASARQAAMEQILKDLEL